MTIRTAMATAIVAWALPACTLTQEISPNDLNPTERGAFTGDGRYFVIGARPQGKSDAGWWVTEITRTATSNYVATNMVAGTLEGTTDGTIGGQPAGDPCVFSGMAASGNLLYAACYAEDARAALLQIDVRAKTVRAGYFTTCNAEPSSSPPCSPISIYPNGMAVDSAGRVYASNTLAHIGVAGGNITVDVQGSHVVTQITVDPVSSRGAHLEFRYHDWLNADIIRDGIAPNGIQIENGVLYYAAGAAINKAAIRSDGSAGLLRTHYLGPALSYIDDFAIREGKIAIARTLPPAIVALDRSLLTGDAVEVGAYPMPLSAVPSGVAYQLDTPAGNPLFPAGSLAITSYFGGGVYVLDRAR